MPTPETAPSLALAEKILPDMLKFASESGWTEANMRRAAIEAGVSDAELAIAAPDGVSSLVVCYLTSLEETCRRDLAALDMETMRIRDKVTHGVRIWFDALGAHKSASLKALDYLAVRPLGPKSVPQIVWSVADLIWTGIGDESTGFTYASKRTSLSGVILSTLTVWRNADDEDTWQAFLDRRIENVMTFEKFKAKFKLPKPPLFA